MCCGLFLLCLAFVDCRHPNTCSLRLKGDEDDEASGGKEACRGDLRLRLLLLLEVEAAVEAGY